MITYSDVRRLLDASVDGADIGAHRAFWRTLSRDDFLAYQVFGKIPLFALDSAGKLDPNESNLVKALEGRNPFGRDLGVPDAKYHRMPARLRAMAHADIQTIKDWITGGCPA